MNKFYITTPIYYVNAAPHIGHSYTTIAADALSRLMRKSLGEDKVWFLTGTDEHGQKIQQAADKMDISAQEFVDRTVPVFKELWKSLNISYNDFIRTTESRHVSFVEQVLNILNKKGDIYPAEYVGWYCVPCETFWTETQIDKPICPDCQRPIKKISETNYFFKMKDHQEWLITYIEEHPDFILPQMRRHEVLSFLRSNTLNDLCISRPKERLSWGIPLPFSPGHVTYVWFDALLNYISAVGVFDAQGKYISKWWPADLQLIGKDILRHHAVYWPIILKALDIPLPKTIFAHGWWLLGDTKMSKSLGNVVDPLKMSDKFGIDTYRYFLLRDVPFGMDGNFSEASLIKRFNGDLANDLGNLVYRTLTMAEKYFQSRIPEVGLDSVPASSPAASAIIEKMKILPEEVASFAEETGNCNFGMALDNIWALIKMANKYVEDTKPWVLAKEGRQEELKIFIRLLCEVIRTVGVALRPFMPDTAALIAEQVAVDMVHKGKPLFPRILID